MEHTKWVERPAWQDNGASWTTDLNFGAGSGVAAVQGGALDGKP